MFHGIKSKSRRNNSLLKFQNATIFLTESKKEVQIRSKKNGNWTPQLIPAVFLDDSLFCQLEINPEK